MKANPSPPPTSSQADSCRLIRCRRNRRQVASPRNALVLRILPRQLCLKQLPALPERNGPVARLRVAEAGVRAVMRGDRAVGTLCALHCHIPDVQECRLGAVALMNTRGAGRVERIRRATRANQKGTLRIVAGLLGIAAFIVRRFGRARE